MGICASEAINPEVVDMSHFRILATVGVGGFGKVRLAIDQKEENINHTKYVAMKFLDVSYYTKTHRRAQLRTERMALTVIDSPFVVCLLHAFKTDTNIVLVMPFFHGGDLCVYLCRNKLNDTQVRYSSAQVILGLEAIHKHDYVYRDLKPENVLLDSAGRCVITDLGLVAKLSAFDRKNQEPFSKRWDPPYDKRLRGVSGTPGYMAPEVFVKSYNQLADFYSLGALIYSLCTNKVPFPNQSRKCFYKSAFALPEAINKFSSRKKSLVKGLCAYYENDRLGHKNFWEGVKKHPYFQTENFSWEAIANQSLESPLVVKEEFNFDIRHNVEDTFALAYEVELVTEKTRRIMEKLKGISYNNIKPFKLSDGTNYDPHAKRRGKKERKKQKQDKKSRKKSENKRNSTENAESTGFGSADGKQNTCRPRLRGRKRISHMSKMSVSGVSRTRNTANDSKTGHSPCHSELPMGDPGGSVRRGYNSGSFSSTVKKNNNILTKSGPIDSDRIADQIAELENVPLHKSFRNLKDPGPPDTKSHEGTLASLTGISRKGGTGTGARSHSSNAKQLHFSGSSKRRKQDFFADIVDAAANMSIPKRMDMLSGSQEGRSKTNAAHFQSNSSVKELSEDGVSAAAAPAAQDST
mmetsp:Transcript_29443/g.51698  ORF Transcript_29443/g.51698 Transcript_29443/m.51698 type:complete len:636 (+) Transcript_29443:43-1950(+)|eukprot:CAMPEP_0197520824 /NCGR_PEP_ID=MMETSP1318-20131121/6150_1 /TAXON_ID=552666 /ORGANISM="Partenskyella glossopodia, Strain RCC365" /LENGTH=635 /DNA_ID=CAMNT_0043072559 /DNA_START=36 /DNA_END=1943 /DNA_ORIENTATION=+